MIIIIKIYFIDLVNKSYRKLFLSLFGDKPSKYNIKLLLKIFFINPRYEGKESFG